MIKITKLDLLIILAVLLYVYFSLNTPKYLQSKGDDIYAAVMTYRSLVERGYGVKVEITGTTNEYKFEKISGIILGSTPTRIYFWDGNRTWLAFDKKEFMRLVEEPQIPYIRPSIMTFYPVEDYNLEVSEECEDNVFVRKVVYIRLNETADEILCDYVASKVWEKYGGEVECKYGENDLKLDFKFVHKLEDEFVSEVLSNFGYHIVEEKITYKECLVLRE